MTRRDYDTIQTALGDALFKLRRIQSMTKDPDHLGEAAFWYTVETIDEYLSLNNKAFNSNQFKDEILRVAMIGETK